jgi:hypothetical protein
LDGVVDGNFGVPFWRETILSLPAQSGQRAFAVEFAALKEVPVSRRVITFDRGSKRRIQEIRWKPIQILSAILLLFLAIVLCIVLAFWEASHYLVQPKTPQFEPAALMGSFVRIVERIDPVGRGQRHSTL